MVSIVVHGPVLVDEYCTAMEPKVFAVAVVPADQFVIL
jgi:hypothetical protein